MCAVLCGVINLQRSRERRVPLVAHSPVEGQNPSNRKHKHLELTVAVADWQCSYNTLSFP